MKAKKPSVDGFITRQQSRRSIGEPMANSETSHIDQPDIYLESQELHTGDNQDRKMHASHKIDEANTLQNNISQSLQEIDSEHHEKKKVKRKHRKKRFWVKIISVVIGIILAIIVGFLLWRAFNLIGSVFKGNIFGIFQQKELKMDSGGRSNVLILGSTDDMADRDGATLTDSMMVLSVDQKKKDAYMFSIPRDLWVKFNRACLCGYEGKINEVYTCASDEDGEAGDTTRMDETRKLVGGLFDMDIQYVVHVNTVVIRDSVNAIGGITVNVSSDDPRGVLDSTFDDLCKTSSGLCKNGHFMQFPNGPNEMNGDQAMTFSQARGMGYQTYGLGQSNFDREKNQQLVLMALKTKAASTGTLTDLGKINGLMEAMGNNLRTNIDAAEIRTVLSIASEMSDSNIHQLTFADKDQPLVTTGWVGSQSVVQPVAGLYDYSDIRAYLKKTIYATPLTKENAAISVVNAGGVSGSAGKESDKLSGFGLTVSSVSNAPEDISGKYKIYQLGDSAKYELTRSKLEEIYGVKVTNGNPGFSVEDDVAFVVLIGPDATE